MANVGDKVRLLLEQRQEEAKRAEQQDKELTTLIEGIRSGNDSTGDIVSDFLIAHAYDFKGQYRPQIESIQRTISSAKNKPLLLVNTQDTNEPDMMVDGYGQDQPVPHHPERAFQLRLCVPTSDLELNVREGKAIVKTEKYVKRLNKSYDFISQNLPEKPMPETRPEEGKFELVDGNIEMYAHEIIESAMPSGISELDWMSMGSGKSSFKLYTGREIDDFFIWKSPYHTDDVRIDVNYAKALKMLGLEVPEEFSSELTKLVDGKRREIVQGLEVLLVREQKIIGKIDSTKKRVLAGEGDTAEANFLSSNDVERLKTIRRELYCTLQEASELKIDTIPCTLELSPGKTIDVPKYLSALKEKYTSK